LGCSGSLLDGSLGHMGRFLASLGLSGLTLAALGGPMGSPEGNDYSLQNLVDAFGLVFVRSMVALGAILGLGRLARVVLGSSWGGHGGSLSCS